MAKLQFLKGTGALPVSRDANNVYFKLGAAGEGQIALGDNIWNESVKIKEGDNVLAYSAADGLSASVSLSYDAEGKKIKLVGKGDANLGEIDATAFLKDGMLESASFDGSKLTFVFNTDAGKTQIEVPVESLIDTYTAGNGLSLSDHEFAVKVAGESFLSVDAEGVKLSGVQSAIDDAKAAAVTEANVASAAAKAAADAAQADVDALEQNVAGIDADLTALEGVVNGHIADAVAHITAEERSAWNAAEQNAKTYADDTFQVKGSYETAGAAAEALSEAKTYADGLGVKYDKAGDAAQALVDAKAYADGLASNYDVKGAAAAAETAAKAYADGLATNYDSKGSAAQALVDAKAYADGLGVKYDAVGSASAAETAAKAYADGLASNYDAAGSAAAAKEAAIAEATTKANAAESAAKAYADGLASNYDAAGSAAAAQTAAATDATNKANAAESAAKAYADGLGVKYDAAGSAASAESNAKSYADSLASNYDSKGAAAAAETAAKAYADGLATNYDSKGSAAAAQTAAESYAKSYADGLASNYDAAGSAAAAQTAAATDATNKANAAEANAIAAAESKINAAKSTIDAYTVNGKAISTNPVLNGAEIKLDGFAAVSQASAVVASDTINSAIAKLEKSIADVSAAAVKLGTQEGNVVLTIDDTTNGLSAHLEWGEF